VIAYNLRCGAAHRFEGWFSSSADYDRQNGLRLIACPLCSDTEISKLPSAPYLGRKGNQAPAKGISSPATSDTQEIQPLTNAPLMPEALAKMIDQLATIQSEALKDSAWVGRDFADEARAIHYGESEDRMIHGEASPNEAQDLIEEGIAVSALPLPYIPPLAKN
jgi:hypothetical protein